MTGYGKAEVHYGTKTISAEIKALNSKALDLSTRIASPYREREMEIRARIARALERGKVEFTLRVEDSAAAQGVRLSPERVAGYVQQIRDLSQANGLTPPDGAAMWSALVRLPELMAASEAPVLSDDEWAAASNAVDQAIDHLIAFRQQEGEALAQKFGEKLDNIAALLAAIAPYEGARTAKIRERLEARLGELKGVDYDKNRLEQELIYYIEKLDISEEKQRLTNHLAYFRETMHSGVGQGKKLGFIAQEMGREINTTGSKSNQAEMQNLVVRMKDELEQIKEQVLNVM